MLNKLRLALMLCFSFLSLSQFAHAQPPGGGRGEAMTPTYADLAYADLSEAQKLDIFLPEGEGPFPLVIHIHGGAFRLGDKGMPSSDVQPLLDAGYAVASLNYRLSGEAIFPAAVEDVKAAVRWLRANAETYRLDADHFAAWGGSAGGNLVSMLGTSGDVAEFDNPELGNEGVCASGGELVWPLGLSANGCSI